ncbi:MAG: alpha/beta hydrolase [Pseudomonadota bacterium]
MSGSAQHDLPIIVGLPGFDGSGALFRQLQYALPDTFEFRTVAYGDYASLNDYIEQAEAAVPPNRPVVLLAESFSGPVALELLARGQRQYVGAILCATFAQPPLGLLVSLAHNLRLASFVLPPVSEQILRVFCLNGVDDISQIRDVTSVVRQVGSRAIGSRLAALSEMNATPLLTQLDTPVLLLRASQDRVVRSRYMAPLREMLPDVREQVVDAPHLILQSAPKRCAQIITQFVDLITEPTNET